MTKVSDLPLDDRVGMFLAGLQKDYPDIEIMFGLGVPDGEDDVLLEVMTNLPNKAGYAMLTRMANTLHNPDEEQEFTPNN